MVNRRFSRGVRGLRTRRRALIVCEGNTERSYFDGFRLERRAGSLISIHVEGDPKTVVREAGKRAAQAQSEGDPFDFVCCVFDCDGRDYIGAVCDECGNHAYLPGYSNPSFEVWGILHFEYTTAPMNQSQAEQRLKARFPAYRKGMSNLYLALQQSATSDPNRNAARLAEHHASVSPTMLEWDCSPMTRVHIAMGELDRLFPA